MLWDPAVSDEVLNVATPEALSAPVPRVAAPSLKVAVPVGLAAPATPVIVAVKVTLAPVIAGFDDEITAVVVLALLTTWLRFELLLNL